jgi:mono/diheme cytochrome c family protein
MLYTVIWVLLALFALGLWLVQPGLSQARFERGKYLVEVLGACGNCHTPKDEHGERREKHLAGGQEIREAFGVAVAPNITPDAATGLGRWTDAEIIRAIREGKSRDGRTLGPPMPFHLYRRLSDGDVLAIVQYLRTVPPIHNATAPSRYTIPLPASYGAPVGEVPEPDRSDAVRYGEYLAGPVAHCMDCHTPRGTDGRPDRERPGAGGMAFRGPWGTSFAANLTPDPDTGIGRLDDGQIVAAIHGARRDGQRVLPPMPTAHYTGGIPEADLRAIVAYLRTLRPVRNAVAPPRGPTAAERGD